MLFRACIQSIKILDPDEDLDLGFSGELLNNLEGEGLVSMRTFASPSSTKDNEYTLLRFDITDFNKIGEIHSLLESYRPVYCFNDVCPRKDINCPAFNR